MLFPNIRFGRKRLEYSKFVAVPVIEGGKKVFSENTTVSLKTVTPNSKIYYTLDGSEPTAASTQFTKPFTIDKHDADQNDCGQ